MFVYRSRKEAGECSPVVELVTLTLEGLGSIPIPSTMATATLCAKWVPGLQAEQWRVTAQETWNLDAGAREISTGVLLI